MHLFSRSKEDLQRFERLGYVEGMVPKLDAAPPGLDSFMEQLFTAYAD